MPVETDPNPKSEQELLPPPTSLHLFRFREDELPDVQRIVQGASKLKGNFSTVRRYYGRLDVELGARFERLNATIFDIRSQNKDLASSRSASEAYLRMYGELPQRGASPQEIMDFYSMCLEINTRFGTQIEQGEIKTFGTNIKSPVNRKLANQKYTTLVSEIAPDPPSWFGNNLQAWKLFVGDRANFARYLNADLVMLYGGNIPPQKLAGILGSTSWDALPDWLTERGEELPDRLIIEQELEEDTQEAGSLNQAAERTRNHFMFTKEHAEQKVQGVQKWAMEKFLELFPNEETNFYQFLIYMDMLYDFPEADIKDVSNISMQEARGHVIEADRAREFRIRAFLEEGADKSKELIALWLEDRLKAAGVIGNASEVIDQHIFDVFNLLFSEAENLSGQPSDTWLNIRAANPKLFSILHYDLRPLVVLFSNNELTYLRELTMDSKRRGSVESLIWEMADCISANFDGIGEFAVSDKPLMKALKQFMKFSGTWIRKYWMWAYEELLRSISGQTSEPLVIYQEEQPSAELEEAETAIEEVGRDNLAGWNIFYTERMTTDRNSIAEIPGTTLEERERTLEQFLHTRSISCSIGADSVVRALEWLTSVPQEIEQIRMMKEVAGVDWKKLKRGAVRIFYRLDQAQKEMVFFVHQKKAWKYRF